AGFMGKSDEKDLALHPIIKSKKYRVYAKL
ncbi:MAG: hypothetical protein RL713_1058, partial [Bacteroidota bacterium]